MRAPNEWRLAPVQSPIYEAGQYLLAFGKEPQPVMNVVGNPVIFTCPILLPRRPDAPGLHPEDRGRFGYLTRDLLPPTGTS